MYNEQKNLEKLYKKKIIKNQFKSEKRLKFINYKMCRRIVVT